VLERIKIIGDGHLRMVEAGTRSTGHQAIALHEEWVVRPPTAGRAPRDERGSRKQMRSDSHHRAAVSLRDPPRSRWSRPLWCPARGELRGPRRTQSAGRSPSSTPVC